jgi:hypothetical protein
MVMIERIWNPESMGILDHPKASIWNSRRGRCGI